MQPETNFRFEVNQSAFLQRIQAEIRIGSVVAVKARLVGNGVKRYRRKQLSPPMVGIYLGRSQVQEGEVVYEDYASYFEPSGYIDVVMVQPLTVLRWTSDRSCKQVPTTSYRRPMAVLPTDLMAHAYGEEADSLIDIFLSRAMADASKGEA